MLEHNIRMWLVNAGDYFDTSTYLGKILLMHYNDVIIFHWRSIKFQKMHGSALIKHGDKFSVKIQ